MAEVTAALVKELRDRTGVGLSKCKEALDEASGDIELAIANLRKKGMATAVKKEGRETKEGIIKAKEKGEVIAFVEVNAETDFVVRNEKFQEFVDNLLEEIIKHPSSLVLVDFLKTKYSKDPKLTIDEYRSVIIQSLGENIQIKRIEIYQKKPDHSWGLYIHGFGKLVSFVEISGSNEEEDLAKEIAMHIAAESPEYLTSNEIPERVLSHEKEIAAAQVKGKPAQILDKIVDGKLKAYFKQVCLVEQPFVKNPDITVGGLVEERGKKKGKTLKISQFLRWKAGE